MELLETCRSATSIALVLALVGCEASQQGAEDLALSGSPVDVYRLVVIVRDIDYTRTNGGTLFTIRAPDGRVVASAGFPSTWNSYCANARSELHVFTRSPTSIPYTLESLPKPDPTLKTAYAFASNDTLYIVDMGNDRQFRVQVQNGELLPMVPVRYPDEPRMGCSPFVANGLRYEWAPGQIRACPLEPHENCDSIAIEPTTFPYVFAEQSGRVVAITNWGDALIHGDEGWCRTDFLNDWYAACPPAGTPLLPIPASNRVLQFYSSVRYQDKTYLGRWPDGLLYEFDGHSIVLSADSPPNAGYHGSEAQALAIYCGDLFVGRWPRGTVWIRDLETSAWRRLERLFSHPPDLQPWIPYLGKEPDGTPRAFLGQRVTALAPFADSLVASTANLRSWHEQVSDPDFLTEQQIAEYGTIHRIRRTGCLTTRSPPTSTFSLTFEFTPEVIRVRHGRTLVATARNNGVVPRVEDVVTLGEGVFGTLRGVMLRTETRQRAPQRAP